MTERKQKIKAIFEKLVETNGNALKRLAESDIDVPKYPIVIELNSIQASAVRYALANTWNNEDCMELEIEAMSDVYHAIGDQQNDIRGLK